MTIVEDSPPSLTARDGRTRISAARAAPNLARLTGKAALIFQRRGAATQAHVPRSCGSPPAHAWIKSIDTRREEAPGVIAGSPD